MSGRLLPPHTSRSPVAKAMTVPPGPSLQSGDISSPGSTRPRAAAVAHAVAAAVAITAFWFISHPYLGIVHDARLYVGKVLAEFDPNGVGRDLMFVHDGQFELSVFPIALKYAVAALGPSLGALLLSLLGLGLWLVAMAALAARLAHGRMVWAILILVAVLPPDYGAFQVFSYSEAMAVPRPMAEAGVLLALAMWVSGRTLAALVLLIAAGTVHPIMALSGIAVFLFASCAEDKRWIGGALAGSVCVLAAAALGLPMANRLFTSVDPAWRHILEIRSPYLFPSLWPSETWGPIVVQACTLLIAASLAEGRVRWLFVGVLCASAGGLVAALVVGDFLSSLLLVQVQVWRTIWLLGVFGAASLALCSTGLWEKGPASRAALAFLALSWIVAEDSNISIPACLLALSVHLLERRYAVQVRPRIVVAVWVLFVVVSSITAVLILRDFVAVMQTKPQDAHIGLSMMWTLKIPSLVIALCAAIWANSRMQLGGAGWKLLASAGLVAIAVALWDDRSPWQKALDNGEPERALAQLIASRPGEVLWLQSDLTTPQNGFDAWILTGRANWTTGMQGAGTVFSRPLAMEWHRRVQRLIDLELTSESLRAPFASSKTIGRAPTPSYDGLAQLCRDPDAPAWVIVSVDDPQSLPQSTQARIWRAPVAEFALVINGRESIWKRMDKFAVLACQKRS